MQGCVNDVVISAWFTESVVLPSQSVGVVENLHSNSSRRPDRRTRAMAPAKKKPAEPPMELGRALRCCMRCRLLKSFDQFFDQGCDNCPFLR